jgi:alpha-L-rhamnosidase
MMHTVTQPQAGPTPAAALSAYALRCEHRETPLGIDEPRPRFAWRLRSDEPGTAQRAYRIRVAEGGTGHEAWDSGWVEYPYSDGVEYAGAPLVSRTRYVWRLDLRDAAGMLAAPASSWFETALFEPEAWRAQWIRQDPNRVPDGQPPGRTDRSERTARLKPPPVFRREFVLDDTPARARCHITARGIYELRVNGRRIGDAQLAPGWTEYARRIDYQTYDVTGALRAGPNAIAVTVAEGWWCGYVGANVRHHAEHYGTAPELMAQLHIELPDGSEHTVSTDPGWRYGHGAIRYADLLMGQFTDATQDLAGVDEPGFDDSGWPNAVLSATAPTSLTAASDEPVRITMRVPAVRLTRRGDSVIADFGQNLAGRIELTVRGAERGRSIRLRHAEVLDADGALYTENLRTAEAIDFYVAAGRTAEVFDPCFTTHGFRYAEITGHPGSPAPDDVVALVMHSDTPWTGSFRCSDEMVDRLAANIAWGQRGNFVAVPTDCPQRDERQGWSADAQVFLPTACRNADVSAFFTRWLRDLRDGQSADGAFQDMAPMVGVRPDGAPGWGDAGVVIPHRLWREYADVRLLETSYPGMAAWVDRIARHNPGLVWREAAGKNYGDWLQVDADTPRDLVATAYFGRSAALVAEAAAALDRPADAERYNEMSARVGNAFTAQFARPDGTVGADTQTGYLMALAWNLLPEALVEPAFARLVAGIEARGNRLTSGFLGLPLLCPVLAEHGRPDLAYALLHQDAYPSWGYSVRHGATTVWERWDGWTEHGGFQAPQMNSFNHYALGAVGDWLYGCVAGIGQAPGSIGYRRPVIAPRPGGRLTSAEASQETARGRISCAWELAGDRLEVAVELPPGDDGLVLLPCGDPAGDPGSVLVDGVAAEASPWVRSAVALRPGPGMSTETNTVVRIVVAPGRHRFSAPLPAGARRRA